MVVAGQKVSPVGDIPRQHRFRTIQEETALGGDHGDLFECLDFDRKQPWQFGRSIRPATPPDGILLNTVILFIAGDVDKGACVKTGMAVIRVIGALFELEYFDVNLPACPRRQGSQPIGQRFPDSGRPFIGHRRWCREV